jgi:hypothetical protein
MSLLLQSLNLLAGVPPDATLAYEVKLESFEKSKESWQLDPSQKLEQVWMRQHHFKVSSWSKVPVTVLTNFWKMVRTVPGL